MESVYAKLADRARQLRRKASSSTSSKPQRILIALAGPPGSGKSTIAAEVVARLNGDSPNNPYAIVLPMDGFHLSRATLNAMPNREEAIARRGVHWTYDANGVVELITALHRSRNDLVRMHTAPSFDHATKDPVAGAIRIGPTVQLVVLEGNWILYDGEPWSKISGLVDDTWFVDVQPELALQRVAKRHLISGIELNWEDALHRSMNNDMVNGMLVRANLMTPTISVQSIEE